MQSPIKESTDKVIEDEDDDFGEFSEVQAAPKLQTSSLPTVSLFILIILQPSTISFQDTLTPEQIESLISTCFPMDSLTSSTNEDSFISTDLPSFTTYKDPIKQKPYLESSLS